MRLTVYTLCLVSLAALAVPAAAQDSLGVFGNWGAFRNDRVGKCYAIAMPQERSGRRDYAAFASVGTWPDKGVRGQLHWRTSLSLPRNARVTLVVGEESFTLTGSGANVWARDDRQDAAIRAAMRSASVMSLRARGARGEQFIDRYSLAGVATAMDAASVGCSSQR